MKQFRKEFYFPKILDRDNYAGWEKAGRKTLDIKLKDKADEILGTHRAEPIDTGIQKQWKAILEKAENEC